MRDDIILKLKKDAVERCRERVEMACKIAKEKQSTKEYNGTKEFGITSKRKKDFLF